MRKTPASKKKNRQRPGPHAEARPPSWLSRHRTAVLGALIAASILIRLVYFLQLNATPFIGMHQWRQTDMHFYDGWARQIAAGDWASRAVGVPMHRWHHDVAEYYLARHPDVKPALAGDAARARSAMDPDEVLWSRWMGVPRFYQDPLYAYLIAGAYGIAGTDPRVVLVGQLAMGVFTTVLIWLIARRAFGDAVAACAGALAVLCAPLVFYELLLLRDSLIACAGLGATWLLYRAIDRDRWVWSAVLGVALGIACLLKGTFLLFTAAVVVAMAIQVRRLGRSAIVRALGVGGGLAVALVPALARNMAVRVPPMTLASSGPLTFVASNGVRARPDVGFGIDTPELAAFLGESDGGWRSALARAFDGQGIRSYAALAWRKWDRIWHWFEIPNNENFYYLRRHAPVLAWLPITFWQIGPLAIVGLLLGARRWRDTWPLYLCVAALAAPLVVFYVLGRFRVAVLAALIPFAALTIVDIARGFRTHQFRRTAALAAALAAVWTWTGRPLSADQRLIRTADWILAWSVKYEQEVYGALDARDPARAAAAYLDFFKYEPADEEIVASADPQLAPELADMHRECAQILAASGQRTLAEAQLRRAEHLLSLPLPSHPR